ncbi:hypothetical protein DFH29DRAFT_1007204 [Suillus ampliporus]|nr:hypothetical protein DFH29DRAFT_1007204 [Suillus ampliporus]
MDTTQTLGSVSLVRLISDVKTESLMDPVMSKRKVIDDSSESSTPPHEKKRKILQDRSERKAYRDMPDSSLPPSLKRCAPSRSYAIAGHTAHSATADLPLKTSQERSKCKAYKDMPDGSLPPNLKRRALSRSYAIADLTAHSATEERIFLKGVQSKPMASVICFDAPPPGLDLASLFQLIKDLGCSSFSYSSSDTEDLCTIVPLPLPGSNTSTGCNLRRLSVDSPMFFSPYVASLTLTTLRDSPLTDLSLTHTGLSGIQWAALLQNVHLPLLRMLTNVGQLWIHPGQTVFPPKLQIHSSQKLSRQTPQQIPSSRVLALSVLGGPPSYLISLLATIHSAPYIRNLSLGFGEDLNSNHLSAVLDITQYFMSIQALQLNFFDASQNASLFDVPCDEHCTVPAKHLTISVRGSDPDTLLFRCRPWLDAFHELESVEIQAKYTGPSEKLKIVFSCLGHPFQLKINNPSAGIRLPSVPIHSHPTLIHVCMVDPPPARMGGCKHSYTDM